MAEDRDSQPTDDARSSVERLLERNLVDESGFGKPLSHRAATTPRTVEAYLKAGVRPRRMERAYRALRLECGADAVAFARRWRDRAHAWRFDELNVLIEQHNEWYPVERRLPMNPRTGDYVPVGGRPYRRPVLGPEWVLGQFPPTPPP